MSDGYSADTTALRGVAPQFSSAADQLLDAHERLTASLSAAAGAWGNDEPGTNFGTAYEPAAEEGTAAFGTFAEGLNAIRDNLDASAEQWDSDDHAAEQAFQQQAQGLGY
ncbi:WXG100 family type VII secretion target [Actinoalloteichus hymeniacidonis]|uniref:WXG100 family type VII secretion target n=1 Tax=Actinoalloteichus hymeniacidonis TaxID=340345 RepID=A0AAC9HT47_9PSEU|nr:type VII secretion target [Actinoalloteichus hymeniacidonis]AOS64943.1 hypothetical protein TL08_20760 [Actinoalloteichus hymeniacidonis]MBB5906982.1 uncharacterized protein YukE [Actinoalloteichus hymeniacidonis]